MFCDQMTQSQILFVVVAAVSCVVIPPDAKQLACALFGALFYAVVVVWSPKLSPKPKPDLAKKLAQCDHTPSSVKKVATPLRSRRPVVSARPQASLAVPRVIKPDVYQPSLVPVVATQFQSEDWEGQVNELVSQILPGPEEDQIVQRLVLHVKEAIQTLVPEVEVVGLAQGSLKYGGAFGVAIPELDIVAKANPMVLARRLQHGGPAAGSSLQKAALRTLVDKLISKGGLKFRRSAFQGEEPKVTLLVPVSLGFFADPIPVDFSVNIVTPLCSAALLSGCADMEPRAKALVLFVKRWAKDRGVCHSAKGHLSPYLWSLLVMYFLQVRNEQEGPLLPSLEAFVVSSGLRTQPFRKSSSRQPSTNAATNTDCTKTTVGQLFLEFVDFYTQHFDWRHEAISICAGKRALPDQSLPVHVVKSPVGSIVDVAPTIDDPFKKGSNLGTCMNSMSVARLHEELARAGTMCAEGASLTELLEPWAPERSSDSSNSQPSSPEGHRQANVTPRSYLSTPSKVDRRSNACVTPTKVNRHSNDWVSALLEPSMSTPPKVERRPASGNSTPPKEECPSHKLVSTSGQSQGIRAPPGLEHLSNCLAPRKLAFA